jgi:hypothetical protein
LFSIDPNASASCALPILQSGSLFWKFGSIPGAPASCRLRILQSDSLSLFLRFGLVVALILFALMNFTPGTFAKSASHQKSNENGSAAKSPAGTVTLYGRIDELSYVMSSSGIRVTGGKLPGIVDKISLGSAAAYSGIQKGDKVLKASLDENTVILDIERKGQKYQTKIATNVKGLKSEFEARKIPFSFGDSPFDKELKSLGECELVILLDRSQSMADDHAGCPGDITKWMWSKEQIDNVFLATDRVLENGFNLGLFNDRFQLRSGVTLYDLRQVFDNIRPAGAGKDISGALQTTMNDYFYHRKPGSKPLMIAVITDGLQNTGAPLQDVLIEASKKMNRPGEVVITFLQVGESIRAEELFDDLDRHLVAKGARYHMVHFKPFSELRMRGVLYELMMCVKEVTQDKTAKAQAAAK